MLNANNLVDPLFDFVGVEAGEVENDGSSDAQRPFEAFVPGCGLRDVPPGLLAIHSCPLSSDASAQAEAREFRDGASIVSSLTDEGIYARKFAIKGFDEVLVMSIPVARSELEVRLELRKGGADCVIDITDEFIGRFFDESLRMGFACSDILAHKLGGAAKKVSVGISEQPIDVGLDHPVLCFGKPHE